MSHSVPSDSSPFEPCFLVAPELVLFDRSDLPIYVTPDGKWGDAGLDQTDHGMALDCLFGESGTVHILAAPSSTIAIDLPAADNDPLVELDAIVDGVILPTCEVPLDDFACAPLNIAESEGGNPLVVILHDQWGWDPGTTDWAMDLHG